VDRGFSGLSFTDLDADGDLDLLLAGWNGQLSKQEGFVWLNDGFGRFSDASSAIPPGWTAWWTFAAGDVDQDGDVDIIVRRVSPGPGMGLAWGTLLNDGSAHFTASPIEFSRSTKASGDKSHPSLLDADGDEDLDLVLAGVIDSTLALLQNDGSGHFALAQESRPDVLGITLTWSKVLPVELDGDGDVDLVVGSWGSLRTVSNVTRQITWRSIPRVGQSLTFDLHGPANAPWTIYVATEGELAQLDALSAPPWRLAAQGTLDEDGRGEWTFAVPASPTLAGATWLWRATLGGKTSNFERTTFLGP
jgi:hypothetical protein